MVTDSIQTAKSHLRSVFIRPILLWVRSVKQSTFTFITKDEQETKQLAKSLAQILRGGDVLALDGELGAGKTVFAKGLAEGLGIKEPVDSPTFTIVKEYEGKLPFFHLDLYRLDSSEPLGLEEYLDGEGICLIEWASRISDWLPDDAIRLQLSVLPDLTRKMELTTRLRRVIDWCKDGWGQ